MGNIAYRPPFLPIVFSVETDKTFKVSVSARIVTPLGSVTVSGGAVVRSVRH